MSALKERDSSGLRQVLDNRDPPRRARALVQLSNRNGYEITSALDLLRTISTAARTWHDLSEAVDGLYGIASRAMQAALRLNTTQGVERATAEQMRHRCFVLLLAAVVNLTGEQDEASDEASDDE